MNVTGAHEIDNCVESLCWKWEEKINDILLSGVQDALLTKYKRPLNHLPLGVHFCQPMFNQHRYIMKSRNQCLWHVYSSLIALVTEA